MLGDPQITTASLSPASLPTKDLESDRPNFSSQPPTALCNYTFLLLSLLFVSHTPLSLFLPPPSILPPNQSPPQHTFSDFILSGSSLTMASHIAKRFPETWANPYVKLVILRPGSQHGIDPATNARGLLPRRGSKASFQTDPTPLFPRLPQRYLPFAGRSFRRSLCDCNQHLRAPGLFSSSLLQTQKTSRYFFSLTPRKARASQGGGGDLAR